MVEGTNLPPIQTSVFLRNFSLRSRRLGVVGTRKNGRARRRHARGEGASSPLACLPRARPFSLSPTTFKRLLRRLAQLCEAISVALLRRTTFKPGKFTNFKVLFSLLSTDFLSKVEKTDVEGSIRHVTFEFRCRYLSFPRKKTSVQSGDKKKELN